MHVPLDDLKAVLPALILIGTALTAVAMDVLLPREPERKVLKLLSAVGLMTAFCALMRQEMNVRAFHDAVTADLLYRLLSEAILIATGLAILLSSQYAREHATDSGEYYALVLLAAAGMLLLLQSHDFITFFVSLEILSLSVYTLSGFLRREPRSNEASIKYFVMGAFATGFLLYGMALLYGATGSLRFQEIGAALRATRDGGVTLATLGIVLVTIGLCFKVGAVPFHMWVADVYEGAPTAVTAFMSVTVKAAGFGALVRLLIATGATGQALVWQEILYGAALATMVVGNFLALWQRSVKRMLAYSSVAHTGYALVGLASHPWGADASVFHVFVYTFMTLGAFAFLIHIGRKGNDAETLEDFAGLARKHPWSAMAMTIFMVSLAGIPPTAGFFGKFLLFKAALAAHHYGLVVIGVLTSAVSAYYYLRVVVSMYMHPETKPREEAPSFQTGLVVTACAVFTLLLGLFPSSLAKQAFQSVSRLW